MMRARKRFGQNFLTDSSVIDRIVAAISPAAGEPLIEIGPGHGALTRPLLASGCALTAVEIDRDLISELRTTFPGLNIVEGDVLKLDLAALLAQPSRIVGNLPYNISTPLLFRLFRHIDRIPEMHFMLQLEVVERMAAAPSTSSYGRLSIMTSYFCQADKLFEVSRESFRPAPKVTSAIVRLKPAVHGIEAKDVGLLEFVVTRCFTQRRKTLRNAMKGMLDPDELTAIDIDASLRPENIDLAGFVRCADAVAAKAVS